MKTRHPYRVAVCTAVFMLAMIATPGAARAADQEPDDALKAEIERLEKASELEDDQIDALRELRANPVKRSDSYQMSQEFEEVFKIEDLTDEALALITYSLQTQMAPMGERRYEWGFDDYRLAELFRKTLDHAHAGPATNHAFSRWVRERVVPTMTATAPDSGPRLDHPMIELVKRLLLRDALEAETFDRFVTAFCAKLASGSSRSYGEISAEPQVMAGLCCSKHTTSEHLGRMAQAIVLSVSGGSGAYSYPGPSETMKFILGSPKLTGEQARALLTWVLEFEPGGHLDSRWFELLAQLTTPFDPPDEAFRINPLELYKPSGMRQYREKWRTWWAGRRDEPWPVRKDARRLRYIIAQIESENNGPPAVRIVTDAPVEFGFAYLFADPVAADDATWISLARWSPMQTWQADILGRWYPDNAVMLQEHHFMNSGWSGGGGVYVPGAVRLTSRSSRSRDNRSISSIRSVLLHDLSEGPGPATEQLKDLSFWVNGAVSAAADQVRRMAANPELSSPSVPGEDLGTTLLQLEPYRLPGMDEPMTRLLDDKDPTVAATAALVLARWEAELDAARIIPLLQSDSDAARCAAAEALTLAERPEGLRCLTDRFKEPASSGSAAAILLRLAEATQFTPDARARLGAEIIKAILPRQEEPLRPCVREYLLARRWSGHDFGYQIGAEPAANTAALLKYHAWAENPRPPEDEEESSGARAARD